MVSKKMNIIMNLSYYNNIYLYFTLFQLDFLTIKCFIFKFHISIIFSFLLKFKCKPKTNFSFIFKLKCLMFGLFR